MPYYARKKTTNTYRRPYYKKKWSGYKQEQHRVGKAPPYSSFVLNTMQESYSSTSAAYVTRTYVGSYDISALLYTTGIKADVGVTTWANSGMSVWVGLVEAVGTVDSDGWVNGIRRDIFLTNCKGHTPVVDKRQVRLIRSKKKIVRSASSGIAGDIIVPFWANIASYTGVNRKGQRAGNPKFKLVIVLQSLAAWTNTTNDKVVVDMQTKLYFKSHGAV